MADIWTKKHLALLGTAPDAAIADKLGISRQRVHAKRTALGIPAVGPKGHWPRGKRRNEGVRVRGWPSADAFLETLRDYCAGERKTAELAEQLGVHRKSVYTWLGGAKIPSQERLDQMLAWWKSQRGK